MGTSGWIAAALAAAAVGMVAGRSAGGEKAPEQFAPSRLSTATGEPLEADWGFPAKDCAECHEAQYDDWNGSLHSRAHHDDLYLAFAHKAREEDPALYRFCSGCHAPAAVASGEIPGGKDREATFHTDEGVTCVVCHSVRAMRTLHAGGGADGSIVLEDATTFYGPLADPAKSPAHRSEASALHAKSEFCSNCHTLTHPANGLVIENTFEEWRKGPYAEAGVQCQDCHMRSVPQAVETARTMKTIAVPGLSAKGRERPDVREHTFVGANVNHAATGGGAAHAAAAEARLKSAAAIELRAPDSCAPGASASLEVAVTNRSAGHSIPTSITELRQVWIDVRVVDAAGREVFRSGAVDAAGRVDPRAVMYNSVLADAKGEVTHLPWRATTMLREKLIGPKQTVRERYEVSLPADASGPLTATATLRYRSAPQDVLDELFGKGRFELRTVDMASARATIAVR